MNIYEHLHLALQALRANWLRSLLTALGVIIGVASLVALTAISAGARRSVAADLQRLGPNIILLDGEFVPLPSGEQSATDRTLTPGDLAAVAQLPSVIAVAPRQTVEGMTISAGRTQTSPFVTGLTPLYEQIHNYSATEGRLLTATDDRYGREVMVLGPRPASVLFPGGSPVGQSVRVLNREFTVVGVYASKGSLGGESLDNSVFIPITVAKRVLFGGENVHGADVQVATQAEVEPTMDEIDELMFERHRIGPGHPEDFSTEDQATIINAAEAATSTFQTLTLALGAIALLIGGIGIMNIMLVSVTERTREIGIRKALGAEPGRIQAQFLAEALALCSAGGLIGVAIGVEASRMINRLAGWQTSVAPESLAVAFAAALGVGLFFGYYPARRAAHMPPAVAMRYD
ncbi:MAG: putative transport system permease protein [Solirubrobacterales bacterium]|jgi:putative ABC transport system permease protein|nr:putative transport system permease protein [Solirubrobacterales bacterium]